MSTIADIYTDAIYDNLGPLRANWQPLQPVKLGDFGILVGEAFQRQGNVKDFAIEIGVSETNGGGDQLTFSSKADTTITFNAAGSANTPAASVKASVAISFGSEDSTFFNAAGCSYSSISDKIGLGGAVMGLYDQDKWKREWAVITDLVHAASITIAISSADNANIVLEASGDSPQVDLANASVGLTLKMQKSIGYQVVSKAGTPLIGLSRIQSGIFGIDTDFRPYATSILQGKKLGAPNRYSSHAPAIPREHLMFAALR